jgi:uncharacterized radical SAM superfamily Fe-S cluster-containing enzyme
MQLTMTITLGVNDDEIGAVVGAGMRRSMVKAVALQPVTYSGRYDLAPDPLRRMTLSDVVKGVLRQAGQPVRPGDFVPIPCSHPNCGWITLFIRRFGLTTNVMKYIDPAAVMDQVAYKTLLSTRELRGAVGSDRSGPGRRLVGAIGRRLVRASDVFAVAVKPFMDRFNYDQDRVANCCHHLMDTQGRPTSFCEYNALLRPGDSWASWPHLRGTTSGQA